MNRCIYGTSKRKKNCTIWRKKYFRIIEYVRQRLFAWFVGIICSLGCGYQVSIILYRFANVSHTLPGAEQVTYCQ